MNTKLNKLKCKVYVIIFKSNTPAGKAFDVSLLLVILINMLLVMLDSFENIHDKYGLFFYYAEWVITFIFLIEYILRIWSVNSKWKYILSFYGIIDILAILPPFISLFIPGTQFLISIRTLRLLRIFSIFQMSDYTRQSKFLLQSISKSWSKIAVFMLAVFTAIVVIGTLMFLIEGPENGYENIPISIYWTIVTITTVGYGDIAPVTLIGKFIASITMLIGYSIIAVPTGLITAEAIRQKKIESIKCPRCFTENEKDSNYCKNCGEKLKTID